MTNPATHDLWIGGEHVKPRSGKYFVDLNPVNDTPYFHAAEATAEDVSQAVETADRAWQSYRNALAKDREAMLIKTSLLLERDRQKFLDTLIDEGGSPIGKAMFEVEFSIGYLRAAAGACRRITGETLPSDVPGRFSMTVREPLGVVAGVSPFNVPLLKNVKQIAMALATGNTIVLLPSEEAPAIAYRIAALFHEAGFPAGTVNVVTGNGAEIGDSLTGHELVRMVTFTGSSRVGRHIAELCARNFKKCTLELGGKSPLVILRDADLPAAVEAAVRGTFLYQGQACMASSRIFVERPIAEKVLAPLAGAAGSLPSGDLRDPRTVIGPIISPRQRTRVRLHIEDAVTKGATVRAGGTWNGNVCAATVLSGVQPEMVVYAEETFGPVTSVYVVDSAEEALAKANETKYGLSAAVFTSNIDRALELARGIRAGMVHINAPTLHDEPHAPFGGVGISGMGREGVTADIEAMTELKWITIQAKGAGPAH